MDSTRSLLPMFRSPQPEAVWPDRRPPDNTGHLQVDFPHWL